VRNDENFLRLEARSLKGVYEGVCMPGQALISPVHSQRRREKAMATPFELLCQKRRTPYPLPTNGIFVAITVMNCTFASSGRLAM
jgi:hypothetical protein